MDMHMHMHICDPWYVTALLTSQEGVAVVLCLHGLAQRSTDWLMKEPLQNIFQICVDRIGHGLSSNAPADGFSFADGCVELLEVVDAVYAEFKVPADKKFFVTGHSMGGTWSIEMAACPATRDRIEAIAPVASPLDYWNPRVTEEDRKHKMFKEPGTEMVLRAGKPDCSGAFARKLLTAVAPVRASFKKSGDKKYGQDYGMAGTYRQMTMTKDSASACTPKRARKPSTRSSELLPLFHPSPHAPPLPPPHTLSQFAAIPNGGPLWMLIPSSLRR